MNLRLSWFKSTTSFFQPLNLHSNSICIRNSIFVWNNETLPKALCGKITDLLFSKYACTANQVLLCKPLWLLKRGHRPITTFDLDSSTARCRLSSCYQGYYWHGTATSISHRSVPKQNTDFLVMPRVHYIHCTTFKFPLHSANGFIWIKIQTLEMSIILGTIRPLRLTTLVLCIFFYKLIRPSLEHSVLYLV